MSRVPDGSDGIDAAYLRRVRLDAATGSGRYPFTLPAVSWLVRGGRLEFRSGATFLVGENGCGKSTVIEALAVACGFSAEGSAEGHGQNLRFATRPSRCVLGDHLVVSWGTHRPRTGWFLRGSSYNTVPTEIEHRDRDRDRYIQRLFPVSGGIPSHERSSRESLLDVVLHRFEPDGLYLLDEPEAALSVGGCMALLGRLSELVDDGCQVVVATHSPILLALPGATIYEISADGEIDLVGYDQTLPVRLTRDFLTNPDRYLQHLHDLNDPQAS